MICGWVLFFLNFFLCMSILPAWMYVYHEHWCLWRTEKGAGSSRTKVMKSAGELSWMLGTESGSSVRAASTFEAEPSLHPQWLRYAAPVPIPHP